MERRGGDDGGTGIRAYWAGRPVRLPAPGRSVRARGGAPGPPRDRPEADPGLVLDHRLYLHAAWTTLQRLPLVAPERAYAVEGQVIALCRRLDVEPVGVLARRDRLHLLLKLKPGQTPAAVADRVRSGSTEALVRAGEPVRWARSAALATVSPSEVPYLKRLLTDRIEPW